MYSALRVAARFQKRLADAIIDPKTGVYNFEVAVNALGDLEKDIPWMLEAEDAWREVQGKNGVHNRYDFLREFNTSDPKNQKILDYLKHRDDFATKVKISSYIFQRVQADLLFLGILQQYDLSPRTRKAIEAAAKYHAKSRKRPKEDDALQSYIKMMAELRGHLAAAKDAVNQGRHRSEPVTGPEAGPLKAGPFTLVNTGGFDDKTMGEVKSVVEKSAQLLQAKGLHRVLYGDILVSRTIARQNILAFYLVGKDEMFVRANLRGKQHDAIRTICHELGHRLQFMFLKSKEHEIKSIYRTLSGKAMTGKRERLEQALKEHPVLPGDKYVEKGETWEVTGTDFDGRKLVVKMMRAIQDPATGKEFKQTARISLEGYLANKGQLNYEGASGFVTAYAAKDPDENFAEMIAFWCQDKLPEDQVEMLKQIL